jgi:hypothetical protein
LSVPISSSVRTLKSWTSWRHAFQSCAGLLSGYRTISRGSAEELLPLPPEGGTPLRRGAIDRLLGARQGHPREGRPAESRAPHLVIRDQNADRGTAARRRRGPESIPGRPPKRSGPSRTARPGVASGLGAEAHERSPKRPDVEAATRFDRSRGASGFEFDPLARSGSLGLRDCLPSETGPRRSATGRPARGQAFQRWRGQLVSRGHLPKQGRVETCPR